MNEDVQKGILQMHGQQILRCVYKPHNIPNPTAVNPTNGKIQKEMYHRKCLRTCAIPKWNLLLLLSELWS